MAQIVVDLAQRRRRLEQRQQPLAHRHQPPGAARRGVQPAEDHLALRLRRRDQRRQRVGAFRCAIVGQRGVRRVDVDIEIFGQGVEERDAVVGVQTVERREDVGCDRDARRFPARRQKVGAEGCGIVAAAARPIDQPGAAIQDRRKQVVQRAHRAGPITASGSQVAMPGKTHRMTIATTMQPTKGREPRRMVGSLMSGAMPLMT